MKPELKKYVSRGIEAEIKEHREAISSLTTLRQELIGRKTKRSKRRYRKLTAAEKKAISRRMRAMWAKKRQAQ